MIEHLTVGILFFMGIYAVIHFMAKIIIKINKEI